MGIRGLAVRAWPVIVLVCVSLALRLVYIESTMTTVDDWRTMGMPAEPGLAGTLKFVWQDTAPPLQTLLDRAVVERWGVNLVMLRLPSVAVGVITVVLVYFLTLRCLGDRAAAFATALLFSLAGPPLRYSQQIQPSIYYAFTTAVQLLMMTALARRMRSEDLFSGGTYLLIAVSAQVCLLMLGVNFMSGFFTVSLLLLVLLSAAGSRTEVQQPLGERVKLLLHLCVCLIPWAIVMAIVAGRGGGYRSYIAWAYPDTLMQFAKPMWDTLTYNMDYAYTPDLSHKVMGKNFYTLPMLAVFGAGVAYFCRQSWRHLAFALLSVAFVVVIVKMKAAPLGGVRHSLVYAPALFLLIGYGIVAIKRVLGHTPLGRYPNAVAWAICIYAAGLFLYSGVGMYADRRSRVDIDALARICREYGIKQIYTDISNERIQVRDTIAGGPLAAYGVMITHRPIEEIHADQPALYITDSGDKVLAVKGLSRTGLPICEPRVADNIAARGDFVRLQVCELSKLTHMNDFVVLMLRPASSPAGQPGR
jgi:hypothetical protein